MTDPAVARSACRSRCGTLRVDRPAEMCPGPWNAGSSDSNMPTPTTLAVSRGRARPTALGASVLVTAPASQSLLARDPSLGDVMSGSGSAMGGDAGLSSPMSLMQPGSRRASSRVQRRSRPGRHGWWIDSGRKHHAARGVEGRDGDRLHPGGDGPAVVLVGGGLDDGSENATLVPSLVNSFSVANYARRSRGDSGDSADSPPDSLQREIEDLAAVVDELGGRAHAFGSSGGALLLEAAAAGLPLDRIAVWEVPYAVGGDAVAGWQSYSAALHEALARDDRDAALELFMRLARVPLRDGRTGQGVGVLAGHA